MKYRLNFGAWILLSEEIRCRLEKLKTDGVITVVGINFLECEVVINRPEEYSLT